MAEKKVFSFFGEKKRTKKSLFVILSFGVHAILILSIIVLPLMTADDDLPEVKEVKIFIGKISPPTLPLSKIREHKKNEGKIIKDPVKVVKQIKSAKFIAPDPEIVKDIKEENIFEDDGDIEYGDIPDLGYDSDVLDFRNQDMTQKVKRLGSIEAPKLLKKVVPVYPQTALAARIEGTVIVEARTDVLGNVVSVRIISSTHPFFRESALNAVKQWRYKPYIESGIPRPVVFSVKVQFRLNK